MFPIMVEVDREAQLVHLHREGCEVWSMSYEEARHVKAELAQALFGLNREAWAVPIET